MHGDEQPIEVRLGALLRERHLTMATAESCTGGSIAGLKIGRAHV